MATTRIPTRLDVTHTDGSRSVNDVGQDAEVTVVVKGPHVNLTLNQVASLCHYPLPPSMPSPSKQDYELAVSVLSCIAAMEVGTDDAPKLARDFLQRVKG